MSEAPQKHSWIHRHLHGYMMIVYVLDLALFGMLFARAYIPAPVANFELLLIYGLILVNITPPIAFLARWINSKCVGIYWPVKFASIVGVVGAYLLIGAVMGEMYANSIKVMELPAPPTGVKTIIKPDTPPELILQGIQSIEWYWNLLDEEHKEQARADPIGYYYSHVMVQDKEIFAPYLTTASVGDEEAVKRWQDEFNRISALKAMQNSILMPSKAAGAFGFVFFAGGIVGSIAMAASIAKREGVW